MLLGASEAVFGGLPLQDETQLAWPMLIFDPDAPHLSSQDIIRLIFGESILALKSHHSLSKKQMHMG